MTPQARHGPYLSLTRVEAGKTTSRYVGAAQAALAREQVEAGQQFRAHVAKSSPLAAPGPTSASISVTTSAAKASLKPFF